MQSVATLFRLTQSMSSQTQYNPVLHRVSQFTAACTLLLIFMGGLVTSHQAGMSVPDWPNSYGYNMFTFPPSKWIGGIFYEHTHRLMGTVVGFCSILMLLSAYGWARNSAWRKGFAIGAAATFGLGLLLAISGVFTPGETSAGIAMKRHLTSSAVSFIGLSSVLAAAMFMRNRDERRWMRRLTVVILILVIIQGILGGLRVTLVKIDLAIIHGCLAQACFALMGTAAVATSRWWFTIPQSNPNPIGANVIRLAAVCVIAIYIQLMVGATMRHYQAGLAIPDLPLHYGKLIPPTDQASLDAANAIRFEYQLPPTTLGSIWLHFGHRAGAILVTVLLSAAIIQVLRKQSDRALRNPAFILIVLLFTQLTLGILTVLWKKPADVASLHVATGALTLVATVVLLARAMRMYSPRWRTAPHGFETDFSSKHSIVTA